MRRIATGDPTLERLQDNLEAELADLLTLMKQRAFGQAVPVQSADYAAKPGELVPCRPPAAGMKVHLPKPAKVNDTITVRQLTAGTITLVAAADDNIDGATTYTVPASRRCTVVRVADTWTVVVA